jgi:hypothetical protein
VCLTECLISLFSKLCDSGLLVAEKSWITPCHGHKLSKACWDLGEEKSDFPVLS